MKRLGSSDSLGALMSICPTTEEHSPRNNHVYSRDLQSMLDGLDEEGCVEESGHIAEKKRRLSVDQVKALEKNFEVENKLEPERKVKLAQELGLQPRQVAVCYEALKLNHDALQHDNDSLVKEIRELKAKLQEENTVSNLSVKEEIVVAESENKLMEQSKAAPDTPPLTASESKELNFCFNQSLGASIFTVDHFKDGSSDSDSSAILNEDNSPNAAISSSGVLQNHQLLMSPASSSLNCFQFQKSFPTQFVKMEEHNFFSTEETCNIFADEQAPTLPWYCPDQWT
ncbi:hypothetical protein SLA2020_350230 [Shorea laevis]